MENNLKLELFKQMLIAECFEGQEYCSGLYKAIKILELDKEYTDWAIGKKACKRKALFKTIYEIMEG